MNYREIFVKGWVHIELVKLIIVVFVNTVRLLTFGEAVFQHYL